MSEDRSKPPEHYAVDFVPNPNPEHGDDEVDGLWVADALSDADGLTMDRDSKAEGIAACWKHHDLVVDENRRRKIAEAGAMLVVYIAGPYSGPDAWVREQHIREAEALALQCTTAGYAVICVHAMARYWFGRVPEEKAMEADLVLLERCDAVVLCDGWVKSKGTWSEINHAWDRSIPVYEGIANLRTRFTFDRVPF